MHDAKLGRFRQGLRDPGRGVVCRARGFRSMSIALEGLVKDYGDFVAVRGVDLHCETGKMLGLLGPSGCGKSTTLKMIAGIEDVTEGRILFSGREVQRLAPGARNIAMVFEDYALYAHLSVFENIAFPLRVSHRPKAEIRERVGAILKLLRLEDIQHERVRKLSGGAQQRVSIGRALVRKPEVILFDEPLSHLDADQKVQLRSEIKRLQQLQGLTSILVTHDQTEAIAMCDVIAVMNDGKLEQVATPQTLYDTPANTFVAQFIGEPPMNLLDARLQRTGAGTVIEGPTWRLPISDRHPAIRSMQGGNVTLGLRPEAFRLSDGVEADTVAHLAGEVYFREHRGDTDVLLVALDGTPEGAKAIHIFADVPGPSALREGDRVRLAFDDSRISVFDRETGRNLELGAAAAMDVAA